MGRTDKFRKHGEKKKGKGSKKNNAGSKKDKIHGVKKGSKGAAVQYITRAQALKKLQLSLVDFRRLCILKGIYPRDPKKKPHGLDKTYYHVKDIKFMQHEPLLNKFFELKTFVKKYKKCVAREEDVKKMEDNKPKYTLHHLVRERYPSFGDAIRDLDDCLSMVSLFDALPSDAANELRPDTLEESTRLIHEFLLYVMQKSVNNSAASSSGGGPSGCLKKCFASIKGYYFQAEIAGETITWLTPHKYSQELPPEVDFRVMSTFNEFYRCMLRFINYKLYHLEYYQYPPKFNYKKRQAEIGGLFLKQEAKITSKISAEKLKEDSELEKACIEDFASVAEEVQHLKESSGVNKKQVFSGMRVFLQREVPFHSIYFVLKCGGAEVGWESMPGSPFKKTDEKITHVIIDRPSSQFEMQKGREYIQPQWVLDSFNENIRLPVGPYLPDRTPPPHLSPFVDSSEEGYIPKQREILDKLAKIERDTTNMDTTNMDNMDTTTVDTTTVVNEEEEDAEKKFFDEIQAEMKGLSALEYKEKLKKGILNQDSDDESEDDEKMDHEDDLSEENDEKMDKKESTEKKESTKKKESNEKEKSPEEQPEDIVLPEKKKTKAEREKEEEIENRKALMQKKHKRLYQRIEKGEKQKEDAANTLLKKRMVLEKKTEKKKGVKKQK